MPDISNLYSGYVRGSRFSRVPKTTVEKALKPYSITLATLKGRNDSQLRATAIDAVLKKRGYIKPTRMTKNGPRYSTPKIGPAPAPTRQTTPTPGAKGVDYQLY